MQTQENTKIIGLTPFLIGLTPFFTFSIRERDDPSMFTRNQHMVPRMSIFGDAADSLIVSISLEGFSHGRIG